MLKLKKENKKKVIIYLVTVIVISFLASTKIKLVTEVASLILNPIQTKIYKMSNEIEDVGNGIFRFRELLVENAKNREKLLLLETENNLLKNLKDENERLKTFLEMKKENPSLKIGKVSFRHVYDLYERFYIDLGSDDGIKENMVAVIGDKLVGKINKVEKEFSQVEIITNSDFKLSTANEREILGITKGDDEEITKLVFIPSIDSDINIGDTIYTSGISEFFPKGLILGKIISKGKEEGEFYVEPAVDVLKVKEVVIIGKGEK